MLYPFPLFPIPYSLFSPSLMPPPTLDHAQLIELLYQMMLVRRTEEKVEELFMQGKIFGTMHLCIGQEATAVGACAALQPIDKITSTHRGHGHCLARSGDLNRIMAELLGKATGFCKGKGGSMHIADLESGNLGANGIVAGGPPLAAGAALTSKMTGSGYVVLCFFGDGATNEGSFHEALNLAAIWDLPVVFFCENNQYGMSGHIQEMIRIEHIAERAAAYGMPGVVVEGSDVLEIVRVTREAVERARAGAGPTLIEAKTYRHRGHSRSDARKYRTREEEQYWIREKDPIALYQGKLLEQGILTETEVGEIDRRAVETVARAVEFAESSPEPSLTTLEEDVYA